MKKEKLCSPITHNKLFSIKLQFTPNTLAIDEATSKTPIKGQYKGPSNRNSPLRRYGSTMSRIITKTAKYSISFICGRMLDIVHFF